jgi:hypothetical protein
VKNATTTNGWITPGAAKRGCASVAHLLSLIGGDAHAEACCRELAGAHVDRLLRDEAFEAVRREGNTEGRIWSETRE